VHVKYCLFRDIDNIWTQQHDKITRDWIDSGTDVCIFVNNAYTRQQACNMTQQNIILENKHYNCLLSGFWSVKKEFDFAFSSTIWHKIFAYIESYTEFVYDPKYRDCLYYKNRFIYGFDELALSRIVLPIFMDLNLSFFVVPVKIYDVEYMEK